MIIEYGSTKSFTLKTTMWHNIFNIYAYVFKHTLKKTRLIESKLIFKSGIVKTIFY